MLWIVRDPCNFSSKSEKTRQHGSIAVSKFYAKFGKCLQVGKCCPFQFISINPKSNPKKKQYGFPKKEEGGSGLFGRLKKNAIAERRHPNLSGQSKNFSHILKTVRKIQKLSEQSRNCPDKLETVWIIQKLFGQP